MSDEIVGIIIGIIVIIVIIVALIRITRGLIQRTKDFNLANRIGAKAKEQRFNWFRGRHKVAISLAGILLLSVAAVILIINVINKSGVGESTISQVVFTTSSQEIELGIISSVMIIQTQDANHEPCEVKDDTIITLFTSCGTGHFENGIDLTPFLVPFTS